MDVNSVLRAMAYVIAMEWLLVGPLLLLSIMMFVPGHVPRKARTIGAFCGCTVIWCLGAGLLQYAGLMIGGYVNGLLGILLAVVFTVAYLVWFVMFRRTVTFYALGERCATWVATTFGRGPKRRERAIRRRDRKIAKFVDCLRENKKPSPSIDSLQQNYRLVKEQSNEALKYYRQLSESADLVVRNWMAQYIQFLERACVAMNDPSIGPKVVDTMDEDECAYWVNLLTGALDPTLSIFRDRTNRSAYFKAIESLRYLSAAGDTDPELLQCEAVQAGDGMGAAAV